MSTVFIAVRCFQCSTMQVKQKKKSSNKWTCVVCNEKQSMRKVFAQGFMARDVRKFVQTFNMSRSQFEQQCPNQTLDLVLEHSHDQPQSSNDKKRKSDWSEYIDPKDIHYNEEEDGKEDDLFGRRIVTQLPHKELFKRPTADSSGFGTTYAQDGDRGLWPHFHKRNSIKGKEPINFEPTTANWASNRFDYKSQAEEAISTVEGLRQSFSQADDSNWRTYAKQQVEDVFAESRAWHPTTARVSPTKRAAILQDNNKVTEDNRPRKSQMGTMKGTSKWDSYIAEDDAVDSKWDSYIAEDDAVDLHLKIGRGFTDHKGMDDSLFDTKLYDRRVEEDIHPDFL